jgi:archaellum component FlaC
MQSHVQPVNRIIQRTGVPPPSVKPQPQLHPHPQSQPQFNQRMPPPPPPQQAQQMRGPPPPQQARYVQQQQQRPQSPGLPPLPPPVKTAGPLYGIPIHPLMMFKTHDNKLNEHDLSIGDCFEQLKQIDERLTAVESSGVSDGLHEGEGINGDLTDLMNDGVFINSVVDNIMNTTNFSSIVENVIPLKEENEVLKQQVGGLHDQIGRLHDQFQEWNQKIQELENQILNLRSLNTSCGSIENTIQDKNTTTSDIEFHGVSNDETVSENNGCIDNNDKNDSQEE